MLNDLKTDLETHCKHPETPFFHRIKYDSTSIYLTKTNFYDLLTSKNDHGYYRVFSWDDPRAKNFLRVELNDASPDIGGCTSLGVAKLIGRYRPEGNDLQDVQYETSLGKAFFKSASDEIEGRVSKIEHIKEEKIDSSSFMKMNEIIPTGAQGKAIYGQGNYIIDGPAGTGKSTTVLQKIKILQKQNNLNSSQVCVLVKNKSVINNFSQLLDSIDVKKLQIKTVNDFLTDMLQIDIAVCANNISATRERSNDIYEEFCNGTNLTEHISWERGKSFLLKEYPVEKLFKADAELFNLYINYKNKCDEIKNLKVSHGIKIREKKSFLDTEAVRLAEKLEKNILEVKLKQKKRDKKSKILGFDVLLELIKPEEISLSEKEKVLTLGEDADKRDKVNKFKTAESKKIDSLKKSHKDNESARLNEANLILDNIKQIFFSESFAKQVSSSIEEAKLLSLYLNKRAGNESILETVIIDEAQDVSLSNIELIHLFSRNIILTGDELQKEEDSGVGRWDNLCHLSELFSINDSLNIYKLKHNFRQTYELGNCSYNYRQLALHGEVIDIKGEYFDNQKGFNKPKLSFIGDDSDFKNTVESKIQLIKDKFTDNFPVVVFYENNNSLERMKVVLENSNISFSVEYETKRKGEVEFVSTKNIAGREFTVVIAPLANNTPENIIYIMLSRAKYDLTLITGVNRKVDSHIRKLMELNFIL